MSPKRLEKLYRAQKLVPKRLGFDRRFEILEEISSILNTTIYKAYDYKKKDFVAIKLFSFDSPTILYDRDTFIKRWKRMCHHMEKLEHPNILKILFHGINKDKKSIFYVTRYVSGLTLNEYLKQGYLNNLQKKVQIIIELLSALSYAHSKDIIHRDIKPSNILVDYTGSTYLSDFDSARFENMPITRSGKTLGTPEFMSPEQIKGEKIDFRSDMFSLGVLTYYLITGAAPFTGINSSEIASKIVKEKHIPLKRVEKKIPESLSEIVDKVLSKNPADRANDTEEILESFKIIQKEL